MNTTVAALLQIAVLLLALALCYRPLGDYMARTLESPRHTRVERVLYRLIGVDPGADQRWSVYLRSVLAFSVISVLGLYALLRLQPYLPYSLGHDGMPSLQSLNAAVSFVTNTNWQSYSGEAALGYTAQMAGLAVQNFLSAAVGIAVAVALIRGLARTHTDRLGNFWVDLVRITIRILLPIAVVFGIVLIVSGVVQNFAGDTTITTLSGGAQTIPGGPVASQEVIKELGTNGGGFYNANSAHPFENPNGLTNLIEIFLILVIPFSLTRTFGRIVGDLRQGYAILAVMASIWATVTGLLIWAEFNHAGPALQLAGSAMEGKEVRFGVPMSALFAPPTTGTSTGAVDSMHYSFTAYGGGLAIFNMTLGEVSPGGTGSGLYGMLIAAHRRGVHRRTHGRPHPGVPGQEDRRPRDEARVAVHPDHARAGAARTWCGHGHRGGSIIDAEPRRARPVRGVLRLRVGVEQQRIGVRGVEREYRLLQRRACGGDVPGSAAADLLRAGPGRVPRPAGHVAAVGGDPANASTPVRPAHCRRHPHRGRADLRACSGPRPPRGGTVMTTLSPAPDVVPEARVGSGLFEPRSLLTSLPEALRKLDPRAMWHNPVMFVVLVGAVLTTIAAVVEPSAFAWWITVWLWLTVIFANLAEAVAEGRGRAQAASLRATRRDTMARLLGAGGAETSVAATELRLGDRVVCEAGDIVPGDGDVVEGVASVDESAITGESAPVIRESGGDRSAVTGGTKVLSDRIVIQITAAPGHTFIDRMIALVEGASRQKTPNEIALNILLSSLTIIFLLVVMTLQPLADYSGATQSVIVLVALLVCLIPTTIGALLSAIGIAGMDRLVQRNVLAMSGRAVEAAGDVSTLLLDKTGTITLGNRQAVELIPAPGVGVEQLADAAQLSSLADETPEGRSIVVLCKERYGLRARDEGALLHAVWVPFTAQTRMSGVDVDDRSVRKGAAGAVFAHVAAEGGTTPSR